jgi:pimeloyl-ACP methyl ester carboxylesterase
MEYDIVTSVGKLRVRHIIESDIRPTVVFLHDSLGSIEQWRNFPERLGISSLCNVLVYDRQGHGQSDPFFLERRDVSYMETEARILNEVLEICGVSKAYFFGHSDGGTIALLFGSMYPDKTHGIISEAAHIFVEEITLQGIRRTVALYENNGLREKLIRYHGEKTDTLFSAWADTWLSEEFRNWNIIDHLLRIFCPVLAIQGHSDEYGTIRQVHGITENVPGKAAGFVIPATGHVPHREVPEAVLEEARRFINEIWTATGKKVCW